MTDSAEIRPQQPRFGERKLHTSPDAPLRHFEPVESVTEKNRGKGLFRHLLNLRPFRRVRTEDEKVDVPRDRFGNRVFTTTTGSAYHERSGEETKAALLVSREGESFLHDNPHILTDLDFALETFAKARDNGQHHGEIELIHGGKLWRIGKGTKNSLIHVLQTKNGKKYIIKVHNNPGAHNVKDAMQPYSNEMLQTQAIVTDLKGLFDKANVKLPNFLFASGFVSCTEYVEGRHPTRDELRPKMHEHNIIPAVEDYIEVRRNTSLWENIYPDAYTTEDSRGSRPQETVFKTDNFILHPDGRIVWIDPVMFSTIPPKW